MKLFPSRSFARAGKPVSLLLPALFAFVLLASHPARSAEDRNAVVRRDRDEIGSSGSWIYNDLPRGFAEARRTGAPLLVVLRCVP
jgi:serine protease Do